MIARAALAVLLAIVTTVVGPTGPAVVHHTATLPTDRDAFLTEDSPRWSCLTDGNGLCGPFHGPTT